MTEEKTEGAMVMVPRAELKHALAQALWQIDQGEVTEARKLIVSAQDILTAAAQQSADLWNDLGRDGSLKSIAQCADSIRMNIEAVPGWDDDHLSITNHCHATVIRDDALALAATQQSPISGEGADAVEQARKNLLIRFHKTRLTQDVMVDANDLSLLLYPPVPSISGEGGR